MIKARHQNLLSLPNTVKRVPASENTDDNPRDHIERGQHIQGQITPKHKIPWFSVLPVLLVI